MKIIDGYIKFGHPYFKIDVYGYSPKQTVSVEAMFDSGFSGFLSLPLAQCLQSALILASTANYTLADGSSQITLLAIGTVKPDSTVKVTGAITISMTSLSTLLGMEFLNKVGGKFEIDLAKNSVRIVNIPDTQLSLPQIKK